MNKKEIKFLLDEHLIPCKDDKYYLLRVARDSLFPEPEEIKALSSFQRYQMQRWYGKTPEEFLSKYPDTAIGGNNTITFIKIYTKWHSGDDEYKEGWAYRRDTWSIGPYYFPKIDSNMSLPIPFNIVELMDHINSVDGVIGKRWAQWKDEHIIRLPVHPVRIASIRRCNDKLSRRNIKSRKPERLKILLRGNAVC